eukprot:COSAG02_NODE_4908_length_4846_cov_1.506214_3_plen_109_part_00
MAKACAPCSVLLTDNQPAAILNAQHNINANGLSSSTEPAVSVEVCDWEAVAAGADFDLSDTGFDSDAGSSGGALAGEESVAGLSSKLREADTIIAADVVSACSNTRMP